MGREGKAGFCKTRAVGSGWRGDSCRRRQRGETRGAPVLLLGTPRKAGTRASSGHYCGSGAAVHSGRSINAQCSAGSRWGSPLLGGGPWLLQAGVGGSPRPLCWDLGPRKSLKQVGSAMEQTQVPPWGCARVSPRRSGGAGPRPAWNRLLAFPEPGGGSGARGRPMGAKSCALPHQAARPLAASSRWAGAGRRLLATAGRVLWGRGQGGARTLDSAGSTGYEGVSPPPRVPKRQTRPHSW